MDLIHVSPTNATIKDSPVFLYEDVEISLNTIINPSMYMHATLTPIQFRIHRTSTNYTATFDTKKSFRLYKAKHLIGVYYDEDKEQWREMQSFFDEEAERISVVIPKDVTVFGFALNIAWYSTFTQHLANEYPLWTEIKMNTASIGQQFLNFFGLTFEEATDWINWVGEQKYISSLDVTQVDWCYIYEIPLSIDFEDANNLYEVFATVENKKTVLNEIYTVRTFFEYYKDRGYLIDTVNRRLLTRREYKDLGIQQNGQSVLLVRKTHHIWNSVDEMALLFGIMRVEGESNENLKERTFEVFRYPSGAHKMGLFYGIARELLLMNRYTWKDDTKDLYLRVNEHDILKETIHIDHLPLSSYKNLTVTEYENGDIRIQKMNKRTSHHITFLKDMQLHELYNHKLDEVLDGLMFTGRGEASEKLFSWVNEIKQVSPIMWDQTKWNRHEWDTVDKKATGLGYIPNQWDSTLDAWEDPAEEVNEIDEA